MRAAYIKQVGPPDIIQYGEVPEPALNPDEVLVAVHTSAINPIDLYIRSGVVAMPLSFPFVPHADLAGTVVRIGSAVSRFRVGDRVWGSNQGLLGRQGTAAELAAVNQDWLYPIPQSVREEHAATVALTGITAHLGLFRTGRLQAGETVFVNGGTGGVGSMVVQMAKVAGARVITTAGSEEKAALCQSIGADLALNYKTDNLPDAIKRFTQDKGVDLWFETQRDPNLEQIIALMNRRGRIVVIAGRAAKPSLPFGSFYPRDLTILGFAMFNASAEEQRFCAVDINRWLANGALKPLIGRTFPLAETAAAHRFLEDNTLHSAGTLVGKVIISVA